MPAATLSNDTRETRRDLPVIAKPGVAPGAAAKGIVKLITCGSVDDGKSTLIGRLLWDSTHLHDDLRERLLKNRTDGSQRPDFSRLVDGLMAEQEQGITIDICWHYFDTPSRRVVIIDSPGHEQYTRNMATGASHADLGVILVDARSGIKRQTRRHLAILDLSGVRQVVLAVNKMDLVNWDEARFESIRADFADAAAQFPNIAWTAIPLAALSGDNVVRRSEEMPWYDGLTLAAFLDSVNTTDGGGRTEFSIPVQLVLRDGQDFRGFAGSVTGGPVRRGDAVRAVLSGQTSRVTAIRTMDGDLLEAVAGKAVVLELEDDRDISRGEVLVAPSSPVKGADALSARVIWLAGGEFAPVKGYLIQTVADLAPIRAFEVKARLDLDTLMTEQVDACASNDIVDVKVTLARPVALSLFNQNREMGSFLILDSLTGAAVAGGVVTAFDQQNTERTGFELTREMLDDGLCAGIPSGEEYRRRAMEAAILLNAAGVDVRFAPSLLSGAV